MVYEVIVDISNSEVDKIFDYQSPFALPIGCRVLVPFGRQQLEGFVIGTKDSSTYQTKDVIMRLDDFVAITPEMVDLAIYLKKYNNLRYIDSLRLFIPSKLRGGRVKPLIKNLISLATNIVVADILPTIRASAVAQIGILNRLADSSMYESELNSEFNPSAVKTLLKKGYLISESVTVGRVPQGITLQKKKIELTDEQKNAVDKITNSTNKFSLLHGVTGSGKTEIYMSVIDKILDENKTAIMLVPEISLTPQMLGVFRSRFGTKVSLLHSGLSDGERYDEWRRLLTGEATVALGARSAIFAPVSNVGVIIIDEEHDNSYVSESNPRYFTHNIAKIRAKYNDAILILGSATPSIDSYLRAKNKEYQLITLVNRVNKREMPRIESVDMRQEIKSGNLSLFSRALLRELELAINANNQAMIFINRRGYSSFIRCRDCGYVPKCTDCDISLTYHKEDERLKCHYCGKQYHKIDICPICGSENLKQGKIGTERVVAELQKIFPKTSILRMDNDTTTTKDAYINILSAFGRGEAQILVGTQMIAKGHDFKNVTLVGILDADIALYFSDYRSNERTFQLITQVAGRAGREQKAGKVILQTFSPNHYVFKYAERYDYIGFFEKESNIREVSKFPPYTQIVRVLILSKEEEIANSAARDYYNQLKTFTADIPQIFRIQAMRAPIKKIQTNFRFQIVMWFNAEYEQQIMPLIYAKVSTINIKNVSAFVEINPQQMI